MFSETWHQVEKLSVPPASSPLSLFQAEGSPVEHPRHTCIDPASKSSILGRAPRLGWSGSEPRSPPAAHAYAHVSKAMPPSSHLKSFEFAVVETAMLIRGPKPQVKLVFQLQRSGVAWRSDCAQSC